MTQPDGADYEAATGHEITCTAGFNDICTCTSALAQLRQRIADAIQQAAHDCDSDTGPDAGACRAQHPIQIGAWHHGVVSEVYGPVDAITTAVLAAVQPEMAELADYRNRITWETNCGEHARLLDSCYAETVRAEQAEAEVKRLSDLVDRLGLTERQQRDALARVRRLHDRLTATDELADPDDEITRGAAAKRIAAALDGWTPSPPAP
jgi:hypothetical protein